ncbi:hypothetical protein TWF718_003587 [Orbilia javanica]|uniref:Uncharacterized protein n=1 Tax=Orbilia javanica TaxID=47235 RepID=A0AAN8RED9_9PEZI
MVLPPRLRGSTHLFSFLSVLASSRNSLRHRPIRSAFHSRNQTFSSAAVLRKQRATHGASAKSYKNLQLQPEDREYIRNQYNPMKPKRLRTEEDFLKALRANGYVPAIDRVDEMLDMNRSPFQSKDHFDKVTLALLLSSAKSANGEIRNPYRIPGLSAGQNPVRTRTDDPAVPLPAHYFFLFPDDTNWHTISKNFPLPEPPRPWHPIKMTGLKQDYTREEVARRLEWSQVQNAKMLRNGYNWAAPDPASYKYLAELPPPPPPVIRECNTCKKPRFLMRFWNFFTQRWQHVSAPHRPLDCQTHQKGGGGRLMYAPKGTKIGGLSPSKVEDKGWIEEETVLRLLFRSGFIALPSINPLLGETLARAAMNGGDSWPWIRRNDITRWALRGGRKNGLIDLSKVTRMDQVEKAREKQQQQFLEEHSEFLDRVKETLKTHPITPEELANIPPGQFYPYTHPAVDVWRKFEMGKVEALRTEKEAAKKLKAASRKALQQKLVHVDHILEEMKKTKAEILLIERGQGETWVNPQWAKLGSADRAGIISNKQNQDHVLFTNKSVDMPPIYSRFDYRSASPEKHKDTTASRWLDNANTPTNDSPTSLDDMSQRLHKNGVGEEYKELISCENREDEPARKQPAFRKTPLPAYHLYHQRFQENLQAKITKLDPDIEEEKDLRDYMTALVEGLQKEKEEYELALVNTREDPATRNLENDGSEPKLQSKI